MRTDAERFESSPELRELDAAAFSASLGALIDVYAAAMRVSPLHIPGRRTIMAAHAAHPAFRALAVTVPPGPGPESAEAGPVVAFTYGFHGTAGQWWHDMVRSALTARSGAGAAGAWLADSFEIAELHVRPGYQQRGIGRQLLFRLTAGLAERTAVLSTMDAQSPARRLYRSLGFADLLTDYRFIPGDVPYAVMGVTLPLRGARP